MLIISKNNTKINKNIAGWLNSLLVSIYRLFKAYLILNIKIIVYNNKFYFI